jgi:glycine/D-amino acid oxidase-like deaminating enzyme
MHTPHAGIVLGVYNTTAVNAGLCAWSDILGVEDDSVVLPAFGTWLGEYCRRAFGGWGAEGPGEGTARVWSGVLAGSADLLPLIGAVRGKPGLWAAAGFHGHGMARILTCTRGLAAQMGSGDWDERLPRVFDITEERLERARRAAHIPTFQGVGGSVPEIPRL